MPGLVDLSGLAASSLLQRHMAFLAGPVHVLTGQPDAWPVWGPGLVWLPGLEYVRRLTAHQKCITLGRMVLSLPLIWWGGSAGVWTMQPAVARTAAIQQTR